MINELYFANFYEDFKINQVFYHWPGKTITESDNNLFSLLTMNHHPIHLDVEFAKHHLHGQIVVVGTLVFALSVGLTVRDISGNAIVNLGYDEVRHLKPVFINDTIYAKSTILEKRISKNHSDRGIVSVQTEVFNQFEEPIMSFNRSILIPLRNKR